MLPYKPQYMNLGSIKISIMMKRSMLYAALLALSILMISCGDQTKSGTSNRSSGKTAEMLVATNSETRWEGRVGDSIRAFFNQDYEVLPQIEPLFEMAHLPISKLLDNKMFKAHHNILIVEIDETAKENTIEARKDFWAKPQRIINIKSPSEDAFATFFDEKKETIYKIFMDSEYERLQKTFYTFRDREIMSEINKHFGFTLEVPSGFYIATKKAEFMWIRKETKNNSQGLIIYSYDYVDTLAFDQSRIISFRNSITEEFVPGPSEGSYMVVAEDYSPILSRAIDFNGLFAVETRGLWRLENDFMGGPFINYTFVNEKNNKVVTIDCYAYAPNKPKRDLLIQLEAIAHSISLGK
jgi:hypothetical protein